MARSRREKRGAVGPIPIADQVARSLIPGESFCDLACKPVQAISTAVVGL